MEPINLLRATKYLLLLALEPAITAAALAFAFSMANEWDYWAAWAWGIGAFLAFMFLVTGFVLMVAMGVAGVAAAGNRQWWGTKKGSQDRTIVSAIDNRDGTLTTIYSDGTQRRVDINRRGKRR